QLAGYTAEEKLEIAKRYLVPRQIERNGVKRSQVNFSDAGLRTIINEYTREAGVRNLEREIGAVCRKIARQVAEGKRLKRASLSGRPVRDYVAMTGEVTLTGQVLPIGGLKEKALAAQRFGIRCVIAPADNEPDTEDIPEHLRERLDFRFARHVDEVLETAL